MLEMYKIESWIINLFILSTCDARLRDKSRKGTFFCTLWIYTGFPHSSAVWHHSSQLSCYNFQRTIDESIHQPFHSGSRNNCSLTAIPPFSLTSNRQVIKTFIGRTMSWDPKELRYVMNFFHLSCAHGSQKVTKNCRMCQFSLPLFVLI